MKGVQVAADAVAFGGDRCEILRQERGEPVVGLPRGIGAGAEVRLH